MNCWQRKKLEHRHVPKETLTRVDLTSVPLYRSHTISNLHRQPSAIRRLARHSWSQRTCEARSHGSGQLFILHAASQCKYSTALDKCAFEHASVLQPGQRVSAGGVQRRKSWRFLLQGSSKCVACPPPVGPSPFPVRMSFQSKTARGCNSAVDVAGTGDTHLWLLFMQGGGWCAALPVESMHICRCLTFTIATAQPCAQPLHALCMVPRCNTTAGTRLELHRISRLSDRPAGAGTTPLARNGGGRSRP